MKTSVAILSVSMASAMASPFSMSTKQCNVAPSAAANGKVHPYHNGKADTAVDCQTYCASDDSCKSFAFGLVKGAHRASCLLFEEPAAKVPARKDGLHVFDKECAADRVPTSAPTTAQPWGTVPKKVLVRRATQCNCAASGSANNDVQPFKTTTAATAKDCQALAESDTSCLSFLYGLSDDSKSPICKLYKVAASKIPARSDKLFVFDKGCSSKQVPTTAPTEDAPRGIVSVTSKVTLVTEIDTNGESQDTKAKETKAKDTKAKDTKAKDTKSKDTKTDEQKAQHNGAGNAKSTKVQKSQPKVTKVAKVDGNKVQYAEPEATEHAEKPKTKCTTNLNAKPKATKTAKVENKKVQYAEPTKVSNPKTKVVSKVTEVENNDVAEDTKVKNTKAKDTKAKDTKAKDTESKNTESKGTESKDTESKDTETKTTESKSTEYKDTEVSDTKAKAEDNKQAKATKVQNQQYQATKVAKVESNKETKNTKYNEAQGSNNKDAKVESPKTLVTKVRNNQQQATQVAKADGKKSECKTTKASNAQPKVTQAY
ncbi:hypothetical protein FSPOR_5634 [Fusarium sporotrichioides]|uniref:Apple domain-containing protein n=1 Tax=Fusarium sporotrichioides TaxID=5514 RepID=A0A395S6D1_FUSSP|nr:hypothetical protein FSPOR_5634 [Fusarium sporotrichioides]